MRTASWPRLSASSGQARAAYSQNNLGFSLDWGGNDLGLAGSRKASQIDVRA
jgi:hypothetical protein